MALAASRYDDLVQETKVHRRLYVDPTIFDEELRRIFGAAWVFFAHESEVPNPGDIKTDTIGRQPLLMVRGADGRVRVFYNACRHRGAKVCTEAYGSERRLRCMYHGWTYDTHGKLIGVPLRERFRDFDPAPDFGLVPVPRVAAYRGFVFICLADNGPSLETHLGRACHYLDELCDRAPAGEIEALRPIKCAYPGNWKLALENYTDNYHPGVLHQSALETGSTFRGDKYGATTFTLKNSAAEYVERTFGSGHGMQDFGSTRGAMWMNAYANPSYVEALERTHGPQRAAELAAMDVHVTIYPNLLIHTRMNNYRVVKPVAVDRSEVWTYPCRLKGAPDDVNEELVLNTSHHVSSLGEIQVDDLQCYGWIQEGLQSEGLDWLLLELHGVNERLTAFGELEWNGSSEEVIRHQYRAWRALMAGA